MFQMLPYDHQLCLMAYSYKLDLNACRRPVEQKDLSMDKVLIMHRILLLSCLIAVFTPSLMLPWLIYYYALLSLRLMKFGLKAAENKLKGERLKAAVVLSNLIFKIAFVTFCKKDFQAVLDTIST
ncbi:uncharacterized protein LOC26528617 isoform X2 [Drosophila mojavensis]|uniref:Uncharacterized protein, isoform A n=1 Tax=Drosophila mojavensis TaxID=7230 RepID=A0A0Q9XCU1_DROMO|nr:uncharacterized protein LOC26528617 isoform X2 [Drosophila mojavensis]KRG06406.1 uncharacterized protein Dmoj_GI26976, isoform A [Drosophila mojavensis]